MRLEKEFRALSNKIERMSKMKQGTISKNYKAALDDLRKTLSRIYEKYEIDGQVTFEEMRKYGRMDKLDKEVHKVVTQLFKDNSNIAKGTLSGITRETYKNTISIIEGATGRKLKGIVKDLKVDEVINNDMAGLVWSERLGKDRIDLIFDINKEIKQGLREGDTYGAMSERLKKRLGTSTGKTNTIVRTESARVMAETQRSSLDSISKQGVKMTKTWKTANDEDVRGNDPNDTMDHVAMNNVTIPIEEDFVLPDGSSGYGPTLTNSFNDINCRCILVINVGDY